MAVEFKPGDVVMVEDQDTGEKSQAVVLKRIDDTGWYEIQLQQDGDTPWVEEGLITPCS